MSTQTNVQTFDAELVQDLSATGDITMASLAPTSLLWTAVNDIFTLGSQVSSDLLAAGKQAIFGTGLAPDLSGQHGYLLLEGMTFATAQEASQYMLNYPAPGVDDSATGGAQNGEIQTLIGRNDIVIHVDSNGMHLQNETLPDHAFYPGTVDRYVEQMPNGQWGIVDVGRGGGLLPTLNDYIPQILFGSPTQNILHGHLFLMN